MGVPNKKNKNELSLNEVPKRFNNFPIRKKSCN